ncbi:hypothetical protein MA16_Dca003898 [Dendrobium catenatum]|uniref:Uncharacterized protein n=1 Tax=Dendrobium catenatum TaxID=906689 RepID=A0A2I0X1V2_9ASPA|nr:hypothetical protein MA16_Dca003898 [Dendrobium catenatum]
MGMIFILASSFLPTAVNKFDILSMDSDDMVEDGVEGKSKDNGHKASLLWLMMLDYGGMWVVEKVIAITRLIVVQLRSCGLRKFGPGLLAALFLFIFGEGVLTDKFRGKFWKADGFVDKTLPRDFSLILRGLYDLCSGFL